MKASKYNFFTAATEGKRIAFNGVSCALARIDEEHFHEYGLIERGEEGKSTLEPIKKKEIYQALERGGFILADESLDEIDFFSFAYNKKKYSDEVLNLTIAPTLDCNFNCYYCYEKKVKKSKAYMSAKTQEELIQFIGFYLKGRRDLAISWYGGEPLLAIDTIFSLSGHFLALCKEKDCRYESSIITNGFLLSKETVDRLAQCKITHAQVTIDGPQDIHDARRQAPGHTGTFDTIMKNIDYARKFMTISLRVNVDKNNVETVGELLDYLKENGLTDNIGVYMGRVVDCHKDFSRQQMNLLLEQEEYFQKMKEVFKKAIMEKNIVWFGPYPSPRVLPCGAVNVGTFAIDPDGYVYKCWEVLGMREEAVFHLSKPEMINRQQLRWINWDARDDQECRECKFFPMCNGGCVLDAMKGKKSCAHWRYNLEGMLGILAYKYENLVKKEVK